MRCIPVALQHNTAMVGRTRAVCEFGPVPADTHERYGPQVRHSDLDKRHSAWGCGCADRGIELWEVPSWKTMTFGTVGASTAAFTVTKRMRMCCA